MGKPILVIGRNRSGTKWLSNILANHEAVYCVQHPRSGGILETNMFNQCPDVFGDLSVGDNCLGFFAYFLKTNFFELAGVPEEALYRQRFHDYFSFFRYFMDEGSSLAGKSHWLQKSDSLSLPSLLKNYPDAKYIIIRRRNVKANIISQLALHKGNAKSDEQASLSVSNKTVLMELLSYYLHIKVENKSLNEANTIQIFYEDLVANKEEVVRSVCQFLDLPFQEALLEDSYQKNTSFKKGIKREEILSPMQHRLIDTLSPLFNALPLNWYQAVFKLRARVFPKDYKERRFVPGTFRLYRDKVGW